MIEWKGRLSEEERALLAQCRTIGGLDTPTTRLVRTLADLLNEYQARLNGLEFVNSAMRDQLNQRQPE